MAKEIKTVLGKIITFNGNQYYVTIFESDIKDTTRLTISKDGFIDIWTAGTKYSYEIFANKNNIIHEIEQCIRDLDNVVNCDIYKVLRQWDGNMDKDVVTLETLHDRTISLKNKLKEV